MFIQKYKDHMVHEYSNDSRCQQMFYESMYMHTQHECKQKNSKDMQITDSSFLREMKIQLLHKDMYIYNIAMIWSLNSHKQKWLDLW